jgi:demethylmenaquinone methyltransferase / 2-methoxy-6-polyprenyl-1,4-benzoquinol methylase
MRHLSEHDADSPAWDREALADPHARADKAARVRRMFDAISPTYERVNRLVSLGRDAAWRRRAVAAANVCPSDVVLDVCCGTGDLIRAFAACNPPPRMILGVDFAGEMLARGRYDNLRVPHHLLQADGLRLPLADQSVDVVSSAFGVRNFQDLDAGLREMRRVLRPGGRVIILEFALPENPVFRALYRIYCERILPILATALSRDRTGAYRYLPSSIRTFERRAAMIARLESCGFSKVVATPMNFGGVVLYLGYARGDQSV